MDYYLERVWFIHRGRGSSGRGIMRWDPDEGFRIDAFVDKLDLGVEEVVEIGKVGIISRGDRCAIRMDLGIGSKAIAPSVVLQDASELYMSGHLSITVQRVLFFDRFNESQRSHDGSGSSIYQVERGFRLPEAVKWEESIAEKKVGRGWYLGGLLHETEGARIYGKKSEKSENAVEFRIHFNNASFPDHYAWRWAEAAGVALSILSGRTVRLLKREAQFGVTRRTEVITKRKVHSLGLLEPLHSRGRIDKEQFLKLTDFLVRGGERARLCRNI